ncbi:MAG: MlaD family protein [Armatimonadota bacterium]
MSAEAKVGLLVIVVVLLALGVAIFLSDTLRTWGAYRITVQFENAHGLDRSARVQFAGVPIGTVEDIEIDPKPVEFPGKPVAVHCLIYSDDVLYATDEFTIRQGALVGDKYIEITRPAEVPARKALEEGSVVGGGGASSVEVVMDEARQLLVAARAAVDAANVVLADAKTQEDMKAMIANLRTATERAAVIAQRSVAVVDTFARASGTNEARLATIMQNLIAASEDVAETTQRAQEMLALSPLPAQVAAAGENIVRASQDLAALAESARERVEVSRADEDLEASIANLREASESLREMSASAAELTSDEQLRGDIEATAANLREASESLKATARAAEELMTDEEITADLRTTVTTVRETVGSSQALLERLDRVMTDIEGTMEQVRRTQQIVTDIQPRTRVQLMQAADGGFRADAAVDLRPSPESRMYWRVGLRDLGDRDGLDLQYSEVRGADVLRAGLFGGDLGLGYDWHYARRFGLEAELYDPDDLRLDVRMRRVLRGDYWLLLGLDRIGRDNDPFLGVRYQTEF